MSGPYSLLPTPYGYEPTYVLFTFGFGPLGHFFRTLEWNLWKESGKPKVDCGKWKLKVRTLRRLALIAKTPRSHRARRAVLGRYVRSAMPSRFGDGQNGNSVWALLQSSK